jgi:hypothetical protein
VLRVAQPPPDTLALREIKFGDRVPQARRVKAAAELLEAGRIYDALDVFLLAGDEPGIAEIRKRAVAEGLPVLLLTLKRAGRMPEAKEWSLAAENALRDGRFREAFRCFLEAGDEAGLARVREKLPGYELYTPQGK